MNKWCEKSVKLATSDNYLDRLFEIYAVQENPKRKLTLEKKEGIRYAFINCDKERLLDECFNSEVSPIKDSYISFLKQDKTAFNRNPKTVDRIYEKIYDLGFDEIIERMERPAESNRQMGQCFRKWVKDGNLSLPVCKNVDEFLSSNDDMVLSQTDSVLGDFARVHLGYGRQTGLDFVCRKNGVFVIGEAKFISAFGGNQTNQFNSAINIFSSITTTSKYRVCPVAILDGVIYLKGNNRFFATLDRTNENVMSVLLLDEFLAEVK